MMLLTTVIERDVNAILMRRRHITWKRMPLLRSALRGLKGRRALPSRLEVLGVVERTANFVVQSLDVSVTLSCLCGKAMT